MTMGAIISYDVYAPYHTHRYVHNIITLLYDEAIHQRRKVVNILYINQSITDAGALGS